MKKIISLVMAFVITMCLAGCNDKRPAIVTTTNGDLEYIGPEGTQNAVVSLPQSVPSTPEGTPIVGNPQPEKPEKVDLVTIYVVASKIEYNNAGMITYKYTYDNEGKRISCKYADLYDGTGKGTYTYDSEGRLTKYTFKEYYEGELDSTSSINYTYDAAGNLTRATTNEGDKYTFTYDGQGRLIGQNKNVYEYDAEGKLIRSVVKESRYTTTRNYEYYYDQSGHLSRIEAPTNDYVDAVYKFDILGNMTGSDYCGILTEYTYTAITVDSKKAEQLTKMYEFLDDQYDIYRIY